MCIIIDANSVGDVSNQTADGRPVLQWLLSGRGGLVVGGKLTKELVRAGLQDTLVQLQRAGRLHRVSDELVFKRETALQKNPELKSNDPHVIALAAEAKCNLIFSKDQGLHADAKNKALCGISLSIYQKAAHKHLLKKCECK